VFFNFKWAPRYSAERRAKQTRTWIEVISRLASPAGNPIVGTAGLLLGLARFRDIDALCLLGETRGYLRDPKSAKSVLSVLQKIVDVKLDLGGLEGEINKTNEIMEKMREIEERRETYAHKIRRMEEERITYIS